MKKITLLKSFLLLCALIVGSNAWAAEWSYTFNASSGIVKGNNTLNYVSWNITHDSGYSANEAAGYHVGSSSKSVSYLQLSTSGISGKITKIVVNAKGNGSGGTISASVNSTAYTAKDNNTSITNTSQDFEFTGNQSGEIVIRLAYSSAVKKNFYVSSITVTYTPTYTVTYNANEATSGTAPTDASSPYLSGSTVTVLDNTGSLVKTGYNFSGWNTKDDGTGTDRAVGSTFTISANTTLYAKWVPAGDYISVAPGIANIDKEGDVAEFTLTTNISEPSYAVEYYTTSTGDVTTTKPSWLGDVEFSGNTLDIVVNENTDYVRSAYLKVYSGSTYSSVITINQGGKVHVSSVSLDKDEATVKVGKTLTLVATVSPDNATDKSVSWKSDDEDVATVDEDGVVTGVAAGPATITVTTTDGSKTAQCNITVIDASITLTDEITISEFPGFSGSGYKTQDYTINDKDWAVTDCMKQDGNLQLKASTGVLTSPTINSSKGFTITVTVPTNSVTVSDGTNSASTVSGSATLTTTKTTATITISAGSNYAQISKIVITPSKDPIATGVSITDPGTLAKDDTGTFSATSTDVAECTKAWSSSNSSVINITNAATGAYTATGRGTAKITYTITPTDAVTYGVVSADLNVNVTAPVEITASNVNMTYGDAAKAIGATTSDSYAGTLTYESGNKNIATVDASGNVTAVAVGTTTITISAPADAEHLYTAGEDKIITVTVSAPSGGSTAAKYTQTADIYETLLSAASGWIYTNWTTSSSYGACSTAGTAGQLKTKDYLIPSKANPCVFFEHTGKTFDDPSVACKLYVQEGDNTPVELTVPTYFKGDKYDDPYIESGDIDISAYIGKTVHFIFDYHPSTDNAGKWEVKNFGIYYDTFGVKLNGFGYATYCSQYPLDFSTENAEDKGFTAWQITDVSEDAITFSQITGTIKGGQGILLKGTANTFVTLTSANGTNELSENLLIGTLAPMNISAGQYFGLSGATFVPVSAGNVPAGKALLPASAIPTQARQLSFIFDEGETTGISEVRGLKSDVRGEFFNLNGQRVATPVKGNIYIVNGKKVMFK